jgi:N6-adenosine-specific RNA methylase IME4
MQLETDREFKALLPPLSEEEFKNLETDCIENGIREPIIIWKNRIVDGYNRHAIARKNGLPFKAKPLGLKTRQDVKNWIVRNQLSRRNLTNEARSYYIGVLYRGLKQNKIKNLKQAAERQNLPIDTAQTIADSFGISARTVRNDLDIADTIDRIGAENPKIKNEILQGKKPITKTDLLKIAPLSDSDLKIIIRKLEGRRNIHLAIKALKQKNIRESVIQQAREKEAGKSGYVDIYTTRKKYRVLYIDAPFNYEFDTYSISTSKDHYPTMSVKEIMALPVPRIADKNSVLFFWTPSPMIEKSLEIIRHWGFAYKAMFVWDKVKHNIGHYNSVRHELLLIAVRGGCLPDTDRLYDSVLSIERPGRHSEKPGEFRRLIEKMYLSGNKIEMFARGKFKKWDAWGYEA